MFGIITRKTKSKTLSLMRRQAYTLAFALRCESAKDAPAMKTGLL